MTKIAISRLLAISGLLVFTAIAATSWARTPQTASALTNCTIAQDQINHDVEETAFLALINAFRASQPTPVAPVIFDDDLDRSAAWLSNDMATNVFFSHTDSSGRQFFTRIANCDYDWIEVGENITAGTTLSTAQAAFNEWFNSPPHKANMLDPDYEEIGIARKQGPCSGAPQLTCWYWTNTFGTRNEPLPTNPAINGLNPSTKAAGAFSFTLAVNGSNFAPGAVVNWNGSPRTTQFISPSQLTATISASDIATIATRNVTVSQTGFLTSNAATFTVTRPKADTNCNGVVTADDAILALRFFAGMATIPGGCTADANGVGGATPTDVGFILRVLAGLVEPV